MGAYSIPPGKSGTVRVFVGKVESVLYKDDKDAEYASAEFIPTYFGKSYVYGNTDLTVTFHLPPGVQPEEPRWHAAPAGFPSEPEAGFDDQGRITYTWRNPNANGEATGNEGATKDLWYHRGAIIIWPKDREFDLVTRMDLDYGIHVLKTSLQEQNLAEGDYRQKIIRLADYILENLPTYHKNEISKELILIEDVELLKKFLRKQMNRYTLSQVDNQIFMQIIERFGWQHFEEDISTYLTPGRGALAWLNSLRLAGVSLSGEGQSVMTRWVNELWKPSLEYGLTKEAIANLVQIVSLLKIEVLTDEIIAFLSRQKQKEFLTGTYGPALVSSLKELKGRDYDQTIMKKFSEDVRQRIIVDFPAPPDAPKDWSREGQVDCDCEFCIEVNKFLPDPERSEISFYKTLKRNLLHIESEVKKSQVELDIEIRQTPPKFEGTCKKNQSRYDNKLKLFDSAQQIVKDLGDSKI